MGQREDGTYYTGVVYIFRGDSLTSISTDYSQVSCHGKQGGGGHVICCNMDKQLLMLFVSLCYTKVSCCDVNKLNHHILPSFTLCQHVVTCNVISVLRGNSILCTTVIRYLPVLLPWCPIDGVWIQ